MPENHLFFWQRIVIELFNISEPFDIDNASCDIAKYGPLPRPNGLNMLIYTIVFSFRLRVIG